MGKEFVQHVRVTGSEEAIAQLRAMGYQVEQLGQDTQQTGQKGGQARDAFSQFGGVESILRRVADGAKTMLLSFAGMGSILKLYQEFKELLLSIEEIQKRFADTAVSLSERSKRFAGQTGLGERESIGFIGGLAETGGLTDAAAESLGLITDIATTDTGGVKNPINRALARLIAPFAAAKSIEGADIENLFRYLKANNLLGSEEDMRVGVSTFVATALASYASNVGGFAGQVNRTVGSMVGAGVSFEDQLRIGAIAIGGAQGNQSEAEEATKTLLSIANPNTEKKLTRLMDAYARSRGQDPTTLSRGDRVLLAFDYLASLDTEAEQKAFFGATSPERAGRLFQAFGPLARSQHSAAAGVVDTATVADYDKIVEEFRTTVRFQKEAERAQQDTADAMRGLEVFSYQQAREVAKRQLDRLRERGDLGALLQLATRDEALIEDLMFKRFDAVLNELRDSGADVSRLDKLRADVQSWAGSWAFPLTGYDDRRLESFVTGVSEAMLRHQGSAVSGQADLGQRQRTTINYNTVNIGTQYTDGDPLLQPPIPLDEND